MTLINPKYDFYQVFKIVAIKKPHHFFSNEAKTFIEGNFMLGNEDTKEKIDLMSFWELISKAEDVLDYVKKIKNVTKKDVTNVVEKYLNKDYALSILTS